jgi:hypothetical protein
MFKISEIEISDQVMHALQNQIEVEAEGDLPEGFTPYIQLVEVDNFEELVLTVKNGDSGQLEKFKLTVERL